MNKLYALLCAGVLALACAAGASATDGGPLHPVDHGTPPTEPQHPGGEHPGDPQHPGGEHPGEHPTPTFECGPGTHAVPKGELHDAFVCAPDDLVCPEPYKPTLIGEPPHQITVCLAKEVTTRIEYRDVPGPPVPGPKGDPYPVEKIVEKQLPGKKVEVFKKAPCERLGLDRQNRFTCIKRVKSPPEIRRIVKKVSVCNCPTKGYVMHVWHGKWTCSPEAQG